MGKKLKISKAQLEQIIVQELLTEGASDRRAAKKAYRQAQKGKGKLRRQIGNKVAKFFGYTREEADTLASLEQIEELGNLAMLAVMRQRYGERIQRELEKVASLLQEAKEDAARLGISDKFEQDFLQFSQTFSDFYENLERYKNGGAFGETEDVEDEEAEDVEDEEAEDVEDEEAYDILGDGIPQLLIGSNPRLNVVKRP